jgi:hypothetical protein
MYKSSSSKNKPLQVQLKYIRDGILYHAACKWGPIILKIKNIWFYLAQRECP